MTSGGLITGHWPRGPKFVACNLFPLFGTRVLEIRPMLNIEKKLGPLSQTWIKCSPRSEWIVIWIFTVKMMRHFLKFRAGSVFGTNAPLML